MNDCTWMPTRYKIKPSYNGMFNEFRNTCSLQIIRGDMLGFLLSQTLSILAYNCLGGGQIKMQKCRGVSRIVIDHPTHPYNGNSMGIFNSDITKTIQQDFFAPCLTVMVSVMFCKKVATRVHSCRKL